MTPRDRDRELALVEALMAGVDAPVLLPRRPAWMADAACRGAGTAIFFPAKGDPTAEARALCSGCPVRLPCRDFAVTGVEAGIWGGTSGRERRKLRREPAA